jgi:hypothetical protein
MLGQLINSVSCHALDTSRTPNDESICADLLDVRKIGEIFFGGSVFFPILPSSRKASNLLECSNEGFIHQKQMKKLTQPSNTP